MYAAFGTQVTIIEMADRVLPLEDRDCSAVVEKSYRKRGMNILTGVKLEKAEIGNDGVTLTITDAKGETQTVEAERVLSAIGRAPLVEDIGLEKAGVKLTDRGFIAVDRQMRTNVEGVYAIGDVAGPPLLAHKGSHEGVACVEAIHGDPHAGIDYDNIPNCTYCHPEVASVGLTEEQAREKGLDIEVGTFPWTANGRALTAGETDGFVKVIRDKKYSEVVGAHIVGPHATELIAEFVVGRHLETTMEEMDRAMHPHPTLSEAVAEAALAAPGPRAAHLARSRDAPPMTPRPAPDTLRGRPRCIGARASGHSVYGVHLFAATVFRFRRRYRMTVAEAIDSFLFHCRYEKNLSPRTLSAYETDLRQFAAALSPEASDDVALLGKSELRAYIQRPCSSRTRKRRSSGRWPRSRRSSATWSATGRSTLPRSARWR